MIEPQTKQEIAEALKMLNSTSEITREDGARRLGKLGVAHPKIIERLQLLQSQDIFEEVRSSAAQSLAALQSMDTKTKPSEPAAFDAPVLSPQLRTINEESKMNDQAIIALLQRQSQILENMQAFMSQSAETQKNHINFRTHIVDIDMSISAMASFMLKWMVATIPVAIVLGMVWFVISIVLMMIGGMAR